MKVETLVLPFRGEFGLKIRYHVPVVHALGSVIVCAEPGEESLYPRAKEIIDVARNNDDRRRHSYAVDRDFINSLRPELEERYPNTQFTETCREMPEERFIPDPQVRLGLKADVIVCPRWRRYGASKNWQHWVKLTHQLKAAGLKVMAAGNRDASSDVPALKLWEFQRPLDASIEAMRNARLVVATDAGLAHLAVLCGAPLLLISHGAGVVAPGPVLDEHGTVERSAYWTICFEEYYHSANHTGSPIDVVQDGWMEPDKVLSAVLARLI